MALSLSREELERFANKAKPLEDDELCLDGEEDLDRIFATLVRDILDEEARKEAKED